MLPILNVGPLALPLAPLLLLVGIWLGLEAGERHAPRYGVDPNAIYYLTLIGLAAGLTGARLGYAAQSPQAFLASPLSLLAPQPQMLDSWTGLLVGGLAALIYGQRKHLPLWPTLDALTSLFAVMAVALGLSHLASGDAFGAAAPGLPWAIFLWGELRHPAQVYEIIAALLILALLWPTSPARTFFSKGSALPLLKNVFNELPGTRFWVFVALSAAARLFLEAFRGDSLLLLNSLRLAQVIAWFVLALALWQLGKRLLRQTSFPS